MPDSAESNARHLIWNQSFDARYTKIWFTSDLHLGHANVIKFDHRPFTDVREMADSIRDMWNRKVQPGEHVFILGDVIWGSQKTALENFNKNFNGIKHIILGNHDKEHDHNFDCFETVDRLAKIVVTGPDGKRQGMTLCHYPMMSWDGSFRKEWNLFGHVHNNMKIEDYRFNQCNVGYPSDWGFIDNKFDLYSFEDVKAKIEWINDNLEQLKSNKPKVL